MGLFGRKKSKSKIADSTYSPPEDPPSGVAEAASADDDIVKVASVDISDPESGSKNGTPEEDVEKPSVFEKVLSLLSMKSADDGETPYSEHEDGSEVKKSKKDEAMDRVTASWATFLGLWFSLSKVTQVSLLAGAAVGAVGVVALAATGGQAPMFPAHINVAFVGNSYFYVNDLPRFVEQIAGGHITQDSVLHNEASILQIIMTGNGMWSKWATKQAMNGGVKFETSRNTTEYLYDMGSCSVPQLLTGSDESISYQNQLGTFINDGQNPCFQQEAYREYQESTSLKDSWDFVVITDQSKTMAFDDTRQDALLAFNYTYGPILKKHQISPIIVQPHAYSSSGSSSAGLDDLATFTALIMEGAQVYKKYLNKRTGMFARAHIAPVGNAFLAVYEESPKDLWPKLFLDDGVHPSAHGTFLYGCVIYATMTGYMPKYKRVVVDNMESSQIFSTARRLQTSSSQAGFPTKNEAAVLYRIAKKVAVKGYKPKALKGFKTENADASFLRSGNNAEYNGDQQYAQNQGNNNGNYNGDYGNYDSYEGNDGNNYNYQAENNYNGDENYNNGGYDNDEDNGGNNSDYAYNGDYNNNDGDYNNNDNNNDNGDYNDNANDGTYDQGNGNNYNEAAQQYYEQYSQNKNNNNGASQQYQYGGGNSNSNQFYYSDLTDDDESGRK